MTRPRRPEALLAWLLTALLLGGCSMGQMVARSSLSIMDGSIEAMNRESDLELARSAIPANLKLMEGLIEEDPKNVALRVYAAQGFYGYAFGFVELEDPARALALYRRGYEHGREALRQLGLSLDLGLSSPDEIRAATADLGPGAVPALFWTASNWAKRIDLQRTEPGLIAQLSGTAALMERVLELDERFYFGGPHLFFGIYYGSRAPMLGGDFGLAETHFAAANRVNDDRLLIVDVLYAEYFARQRLDQAAFQARIRRVREAPDGLMPEMELANRIAKERADWLLTQEEDWF